MSRIPYFDLSQASPELQQALGSRPPLNVIRMIAHAGPSALGFLSDLLSHRAMVELTLTIGFYMMVSRVLENFEVEIESA